MARANLNKSEKSLDFLYYYHSIKVHTQEALNLQQLKSPFSDPNLFRKSASILMIYPLDSRNTKKTKKTKMLSFFYKTQSYFSQLLQKEPKFQDYVSLKMRQPIFLLLSQILLKT